MITTANTHDKPIWYQGMLLTPQHFQQQDRYWQHNITQCMAVHNFANWGLRELQLDTSLLPIGKVAILSAKGIFPDGTPFTISANCCYPKPFTIQSSQPPLLILLALSLAEDTVTDREAETSSSPLRYHIETQSIADNCREPLEHTDLQIGRLALKLLSDNDDLTEFTTLPIAKISAIRGEQALILDKTYIPPSFHLLTGTHISQWTKEVYSTLISQADQFAARLDARQQSREDELLDMFILQTLQRYETQLHGIQQNLMSHPQTLFNTLSQLYADISIFSESCHRMPQLPPYCHHDIGQCLQPLIKNLLNTLNGIVDQHATSIPLERNDLGIWLGTLADIEWEQATFILAFTVGQMTESLKTQLLKYTKIASLEHIKTLISRALPGIEMTALTTIPRQIPFYPHQCYFRLNTTDKTKQYFDPTQPLAIHIGQNITDLQLTLWAIKE